MIDLKYEYHVQTWGGFYNDEYKKHHNHERGDHYFDTLAERDTYVSILKHIEQKHGCNMLAMTTSEGYNCRVRTVLHRVIRYENKDYYTNYDIGVNYEHSPAQYHLDYKWTCGFNDDPLGEDFDYDTNLENGNIKIIQEWITGAFTED